MIKALNSVGSVIDMETGMIYPQNEDGTFDFKLSISLVDDEVSSEWWDSLSLEDYKICQSLDMTKIFKPKN